MSACAASHFLFGAAEELVKGRTLDLEYILALRAGQVHVTDLGGISKEVTKEKQAMYNTALSLSALLCRPGKARWLWNSQWSTKFQVHNSQTVKGRAHFMLCAQNCPYILLCWF